MQSGFKILSAFDAACSALRKLRTFSAAGEKHLQLFASQVLEPRTWTQVGINHHTNHSVVKRPDLWMQMHSKRAYLKHKAPDDRLTAQELREKLVTDIAHDIGFTVATCALYRHHSRHANSLLRVVACTDPSPVKKAMPEQTSGDAVIPFIQRHMHLQAAFTALNVAHLWFGQMDDHDENFVTSKRHPRTKQRSFYGIDYENVQLRTQHCLHTQLEQSDWCYNLPEVPQLMNAAKAAVIAIENYPEQRLTLLANRLMPYAPVQWSPMQDAEALAQRQRTLRSAVTNNFPLSLIARL